MKKQSPFPHTGKGLCFMGNVAVPKRKSLCKGKETFSSLYRIGLFFLAVRYLGFEGFGAPDDLFKLDVGAEDADDLVVGVGDHRGDGDDELARDLRLMDVRDVQLSGAHGLEEPLAVRVVEPDREGLVALLIAGIADGDGGGVPLHVGDVGILDERVVAHEVLELRGERFRIGGRLAVAGQTLHEVGGQFPGDALHLVELAVEEFRHETADEVLDFLVGEGGVAPFLVGGHDPVVDLADGGMLPAAG